LEAGFPFLERESIHFEKCVMNASNPRDLIVAQSLVADRTRLKRINSDPLWQLGMVAGHFASPGVQVFIRKTLFAPVLFYPKRRERSSAVGGNLAGGPVAHRPREESGTSDRGGGAGASVGTLNGDAVRGRVKSPRRTSLEESASSRS